MLACALSNAISLCTACSLPKWRVAWITSELRACTRRVADVGALDAADVGALDADLDGRAAPAPAMACVCSGIHALEIKARTPDEDAEA